MKITMHSFRTSFLVVFLLLIMKGLLAQELQQRIEISPLVGDEIDTYEYFHFGFNAYFPVRKKDLKHAEIYRSEEKGLYWLVQYFHDGHKDRFLLSEQQFALLQTRIEERGRKILAVYDDIAERLPVMLKVDTEAGSRIIGLCEQLDDGTLFLDSDLGSLEIALEDIIELETIEAEGKLSMGFSSPNATRYLFAPSAIPLRKGEGYYQNVWVVLNMVSYGVTDNLTITGGIEAISTLATIFQQIEVGPIMMGNVKFAAPVSENFYLGAGILGGAAIGSDIGDANLALGYGLLTYGNPESHISLGVGYGQLGGQWSNAPIIMLGGAKRISRRIALVSENWMLAVKEDLTDYKSNGEAFSYSHQSVMMAFSAGIRVLTDKNTFDIALVTAGQVDRYIDWPDDYSWRNEDWSSDWVPIPIPYLDFVYKF